MVSFSENVVLDLVRNMFPTNIVNAALNQRTSRVNGTDDKMKHNMEDTHKPNSMGLLLAVGALGLALTGTAKASWVTFEFARLFPSQGSSRKLEKGKKYPQDFWACT